MRSHDDMVQQVGATWVGCGAPTSCRKQLLEGGGGVLSGIIRKQVTHSRGTCLYNLNSTAVVLSCHLESCAAGACTGQVSSHALGKRGAMVGHSDCQKPFQSYVPSLFSLVDTLVNNLFHWVPSTLSPELWRTWIWSQMDREEGRDATSRVTAGLRSAAKVVVGYSRDGPISSIRKYLAEAICYLWDDVRGGFRTVQFGTVERACTTQWGFDTRGVHLHLP